MLILGAVLYLGLSARGMAIVSPLSWTAEAVYSFYSFQSDGYLIRPAARIESLAVARPEMVQIGGPQENKTASSQELGTTQAGEPIAPVQERASPERTESVTYEVAPGDTISTIAERFEISTETVLWANSLGYTDLIRIGQPLLILPVSGVLHTVAKGDTLLSLAATYGVDAEDILGYKSNNISDANSLAIGQKIIIPGGKMPVSRASPSSRGGVRPAAETPAAPAAAAAAPSGRFAWPTLGPIFQYFSASHFGVDISPPYGTPVRAADGGMVVRAEKLGWGLGWNLEVDHGNGYSTVYAHLSRFEVDRGERVSQGEVIGLVGTTGYVTGPHLHFAVHRNGVPINPLSVLP